MRSTGRFDGQLVTVSCRSNELVCSTSEASHVEIGHTVRGIGFIGLILSLVALFVLPRWVSDFSEQAAEGHTSGN